MEELYPTGIPLADRIALKDMAALDELYDQYAPALYGLILKVVPAEERASELLQRVFLRLWRDIGGYDPARMRLFTWMVQLTNRVVLEHTGGGDHTVCGEVLAVVRAGRQ